MKRRLFTVIAASVLALSSYAQIGSSTSRTIQTHVQQEKYEISYARRYNRLYAGFGIGKASEIGECKNEPFTSSISGPGCLEFGWTIGFPLLKKADLFLETGLDFTPKFLEGVASDETEIDVVGTLFEIPINLTYRLNVGNRNFISPYAGLSVGINPWLDLRVDDSRGGYGNYDGPPLYAGLQLGVNFDIKRFHLGFGWYKNLSNLMCEEYNGYWEYTGIKDEPKMKYSDIRFRIGYTFSRKVKKRIQ